MHFGLGIHYLELSTFFEIAVYTDNAAFVEFIKLHIFQASH